MALKKIYCCYINNIYFFNSINKKFILFNLYILSYLKSIYSFSILIIFFFEYYFFFNFYLKNEKIVSFSTNFFFIYQLINLNKYIYFNTNSNINYISQLNILFNIIYNFKINKLISKNCYFFCYNNFFFNTNNYNKQLYFFFFYPNIYFMLKKF
jgi:hypothetical protein